MAILRYPEILDVSISDVPVPWTDRETMLYALSVGAGADPLDRQDLPLVWEKNLKALPTLGTVIASMRLLREHLELDFAKALAAEHAIVLHRPMPPQCATAVADCRVAAVWDKGADKGAIVAIENTLKSAPGGEVIATNITTLYARGDGGCGAPRDGQPQSHVIPARAPDLVVEAPTQPNQPLFYRLNGDRHPLHVDPDFVQGVGFPRPIMHGLCSFGMTCRLAMRAFADNDPGRIASHQARFSGPFFPGDTLVLHMWRDGDVVSFEAYAKASQAKVISNGKMLLRETAMV